MTLTDFLKIVNGSISDIKIINEEEGLEAVKRNGDALRYVKDQSEAICLEAMKRNGDALRYVKDQSEAICLEAVKRNRDALRYVDIRVFEKSTERKE